METSFFKTSLLDAIIPNDTDTELSDLLESNGDLPGDSTRLLAIKERDILFFDERLRALAVLQLPHCDEDTLRSYLSRLSYTIDVWAIDELSSNDPSAPPTTPPKDLVFSAERIQKNEPMVLASQSTDSSQTLTLIWEVEIVLNRPRFRVPQPAIIFIPSATIGASPPDENKQDGDLTPFQPLEPNVLEPMRLIPGLHDNPPYIAASRLQRTLPVPAAHKPRIHIPHVPSRRHRAVPATIARLRYNKVNAPSASPANVAILDMEIIPFVQVDAAIEHVDLTPKNGRAESLMSGFLPMPCRSGDCLTFMYKLHQATDPNLSLGIGFANTNVDELSIKIRLSVQLNPNCRPQVIMEWTTHVDFTQALNPSFGPPSQPIQRPNRPTSLSVGNGNGSSVTMTAITTSFQPTSDTKLQSGLSISFTASDTPVQVGNPFVWKVLVVNCSAKMAKIAIIPLPRIQRQATQAQFFAKRHAPKSSTASFHPSERRHTKDGDDVDIAQAIADENVVYAMHHSSAIPPETDLMALTAELKIGPLGPGQCHESEIQMVAFESGSLRADAIRIVDLARETEEGAMAMGVVTDIRDLPDIVVANAADETH
ncbi:uncharacterized protein Z518_11123 [Rhinocladiella mackenziei CBS 650.93]|uniref:Trafficking protein particle complex II-specific subunit 65 IgD3 domain-containing protein n=1 Tax=Rhinocladiella mackenziei CBS 650.93 TaxID=1442369 RepID=A0A0D2I8Y6_9EURO|nr:uncharacterized protein Z518_11123 [Rhinocladiella mackenziei CBS 650.93]KIW99710.1 hypothetical protein Z518_11123 [Rhinocladiella mackenziei CBS 650.93]